MSEIGLALPWPQRVIDDLGGRAPAVGDWYAECCLLDMEQITDEERLAALQDLYSDMDTGGTWARSEPEIRRKLAEWAPHGFTNGGSPVHGAMGLVHRAPNGLCSPGDYSVSLVEPVVEHVVFNVTMTRDGSSTHCYGIDAADGSGLINELTPASCPSEAEAALMAAACAGGPGAEHLLPDDIGRLLVLYDERGRSAIDCDGDPQEGNARWLRHTSKPTGGKMRWSAAAITSALIALVVVAALCADIFVVPK